MEHTQEEAGTSSDEQVGANNRQADAFVLDNKLRVLVFAIGVALILVPQWMQSGHTDMVSILVAKRPLVSGGVIVPDDLATAAIPQKYVHPFQIPVDDKFLLDGRTSRYAIEPGQPLLWSDLQEKTLASNSLSSHIPAGYRAISIPLEGIDAFGGLIEAGDSVDLWWNGGSRPKLLLASVPVAALDNSLPGQEAPARPRTATFALPEKQAAMLMRLRNQNRIGFMLRNPADVTDVTAGQAMAELTRPQKKTVKPRRKGPSVSIVTGR